MEFPGLGEHCGWSACNQLDFLPMKCDACGGVFCRDHITYMQHSCTSAYKKDIQVPVCPLCSKPIPVNRGELPDIKVGQHIDTDCQSDPAKAKRKVYTNACSMKGCKQKEMIPVVCSSCRLNYCLKHRHESDHSCKGFQGSGKCISNAGAAATARAQAQKKGKNPPAKTPTVTPQGMSEDEALARALQLSLNDSQPTASNSVKEESALSQEEADRILAQTMQQSEAEYHTEQQRRREKKASCALA